MSTLLAAANLGDSLPHRVFSVPGFVDQEVGIPSSLANGARNVFSPDDQFLVCCSQRGPRVFRTSDWSEVSSYDFGSNTVECVYALPDNLRYVVGHGTNFTEFDYLTSTPVTPVGTIANNVRDFSLAPDESYIGMVLNASSENFRLFNLDSPMSEITPQTITLSGQRWGCDHYPDGSHIATGGHMGNWAHNIDTSDWSVWVPGITPGQIVGVRISPDGKYIAYGTTTGPEVYTLPDYTPVSIDTTGIAGEQCERVAWSSDGKYLAVGIRWTQPMLFVWEVGAGTWAQHAVTVSWGGTGVFDVAFNGFGAVAPGLSALTLGRPF